MKIEGMPHESEADCLHALQVVEAAILNSGALKPVREHEDPEDELVDVECWGALASYVVASTYAPASPMRNGSWARSVGAALRRITKLLGVALAEVAQWLEAAEWSLTISFPWGIGVSLTWPVKAAG
ncbi:hypothetical protein [Streptomyces sp. NPDC050738]|uniref:hypothetical protein n=1 Tax=Streptomyces sp. NPDC050738 TaxID=3154744 RepID=UPI0034246755